MNRDRGWLGVRIQDVTQEIADVEKDKFAMDMGTRAKGLKSMMRTLTFKAAEADTTILISIGLLYVKISDFVTIRNWFICVF